ncbi:MAG: type transport system ATP-binding protein [Eubacteriales bacterium]|nr:type transport system ATP-binding protein [Eubacteriales bacterium]
MAAIKLIDLVRKYGDTVAVDRLNLEVNKGEIFGFLGPNGAGKTTTIKMMTGLLSPTSGRVEVGGFDIVRNPMEAKKILGYVPDVPMLFEKLTGREFLDFVCEIWRVEKKEEKIEYWLRTFELLEVADALIESYSHGMKQKLSMVQALIHEPQILILDEPFTGLDPLSAKKSKDILQEFVAGGGTVFFSTHILDVAERFCDRVGIIVRGRLVAVGTLEELREVSDRTLEDIFLRLISSAGLGEKREES